MACRTELRCITINPEIFHHQEAHGEVSSSEVDVIDSGQVNRFNSSAMGFTVNILSSARRASNPAILGPCLEK